MLSLSPLLASFLWDWRQKIFRIDRQRVHYLIVQKSMRRKASVFGKTPDEYGCTPGSLWCLLVCLVRALEPFESDFNGPLTISKVLARGDVTDEERLLASQRAEDRWWRVNPSFSGIVSEKQCAMNVKCNPERSANVHVLHLNCTNQTKNEKQRKKVDLATTHDWARIDLQV